MTPLVNKANTLLLMAIVSLISFFNACDTSLPKQSQANIPATNTAAADASNVVKRKIQIALLLDTSNSMDGLIDQAKAQLWKLVTELSDAQTEGVKPMVEIALYEYGNDGLSARNHYIRQVSAFTPEMDDVSEKLFALSTNGGEEYCGAVIEHALQSLSWSEDEKDLHVIFIAGNEPFHQGPIEYKNVCKKAYASGIIVNTIHCGDYQEGLQTGWKKGAELGGGQYMCIDADKKTQYIPTPYDDQIVALNDSLNDTYLPFGHKGFEKKNKQIMQDSNARSYGKENMAYRVMSKASEVYATEAWDLVEANKKDKHLLKKVPMQELPPSLQGKSEEEIQKTIRNMGQKRTALRSKIDHLKTERQRYLSKQMPAAQNKSLDEAMLSGLKAAAQQKGFQFSKP